MSLKDTRKKAHDALRDAVTGLSYAQTRDPWDRAIEAIVDASREQVLHDIASRDPRVFDALRSAGLIA